MADNLDTSHSTESTPREKLIEYAFLSDLFRALWRRGVRDGEVLRGEIDRSGHDIVLDVMGIVRHTQLKASFLGATTRKVTLNSRLADKPYGCVIWIFFDPETLELGPFYWFGGRGATVMPSLLDLVALAVENRIIGVWDFAASARRDAGLDASCFQFLPEPGAVVSAIGDEMRYLGQGVEHEASAPVVAHLAFRQEQDDRPSFTVADGVELGVQSAFVRPIRRGTSPF